MTDGELRMANSLGVTEYLNKQLLIFQNLFQIEASAIRHPPSILNRFLN